MRERVGSHICHFYSSLPEAGELLHSFFRHGLEQGEQILCLGSGRELDELQELLCPAADGPENGGARLRFLTWKAIAPEDGSFSFQSRTVLDRLAAERQAARTAGFAGVRIIQELSTWAAADPAALLAYEAGLETAAGPDTSILCLARHRTVSTALLLDLLALHPQAAVAGKIRNNFYCHSSSEETTDRAASLLESKLNNLADAQEELSKTDESSQGRLFSWEKVSRWFAWQKKHASESDSQQRYLAELLLVSNEITATTKLQELYRKTTGLAKDLLDLDFSTLMLLSQERAKLVIHDAIGFPEELIGTFHLSSGQGLSTYVLQTGKPSTVLDFLEETRFAVPPLVLQNHITSAIAVPMVLEGDVFGVLIGHTREQRRFTGQEIGLYQTIANQAALAVRHSLNLKALQESEEKYRKLVESANDAIILLAAESGLVLDSNARAKEMIGLSSNELARRHYLSLHPADEAAAYEKLFRTILKHGKAEMANGAILRPDGRTIPVDISASLSQTRSGRMVQIILRDITQRKRAEEALAAEKERLAVTLGSIGEGVLATDRAGLVTLMNKRGETLTGWEQQEAIGRPLSEVLRLVDDKTRLPLEDPMDRAIETGDAAGLTNQALLVARDGTERIISESATPIRDELQQPMGVVLILRDITAAKKMEKELLRAQKLESVGILAGGIAHDFNNILFAILGYAQLSLVDVPKESPLHNNLKQIVNSGKRAADLVKQILTFSRQTEQERKPMQLEPVLKETVKLLRGTLPTTIKIRQQIEKCRPISADITQIHQVIMNLCTNAYHAMREKGGVLSLEVAETMVDERTASRNPGLQPGQYARLTISDTGHGMNKQTLHQIFDPFFTTKKPGEGTGLGLSTVHGIVMNHEGAITAESSPGEGTVFKVYFPLLREEAEVSQPPLLASALPRLNARVLFVDDEPVIVKMGKRVLKHLGCEVLAYTSSAEALKRYENDPKAFDLVITDQTMPQLTGVELAKAILQKQPEQPIILLTGFSEAVDEQQARALGIRGFVLKPLTIDQLTRAICQALSLPPAESPSAAADAAI